jgi:hypothetical protein
MIVAIAHNRRILDLTHHTLQVKILSRDLDLDGTVSQTSTTRMLLVSLDRTNKAIRAGGMITQVDTDGTIILEQAVAKAISNSQISTRIQTTNQTATRKLVRTNGIIQAGGVAAQMKVGSTVALAVGTTKTRSETFIGIILENKLTPNKNQMRKGQANVQNQASILLNQRSSKVLEKIVVFLCPKRLLGLVSTKCRERASGVVARGP